jgi:threonylcarbamoyladenosine tRNA methylthiotransferase MtaB
MTYLHVFPFSLRDGTPAGKLDGHQASANKKQRSRRLLNLAQEKRLAFHQRFVSRRLTVLVEDRTDASSGLQVGLSDNYIKVLFSGTVRANEIVEIEITQAREDLVFGERI